MAAGRRGGVRRHLGLLVSGGLVLLIGLLGLVAGQQAGQQSRDVHREDRLALQVTLAGLVEQYARVSAAEVMDALSRPPAGGMPFSARAGDPATGERLQALVDETRALDAGAVLVDSTGQPLAGWSVDGTLPARDDPGWLRLRQAVARDDGTIPLSGVLRRGAEPLLALGLPVPLDDGSTGMVLGLWDPKASALQAYVADIDRGPGGGGFVVDAEGLVIAGTDTAGDGQIIGRVAPLGDALDELLTRQSGVLDSTQDGQEIVTTFARAGSTGWTALQLQNAEEFEGALIRSGRMVQVALVGLLLSAGAGLVVLHRRREQSLRRAARHDELTGLYNRRGWFALAEQELAHAQRNGQPRALLFVDLDGLKQINDALGHQEGDNALQDVTAVLQRAAGEADVVGRLGGDEFVLLVGEHDSAESMRLRLHQVLAEHNAGSTSPFELRLSVGAEVWFPEEACSLDELVRRADEMMYADKSSRPDRSTGLLRERDRAVPAG